MRELWLARFAACVCWSVGESCGGGVAVMENCSVGELCGSFSVEQLLCGKLRFRENAVWGSCDVGEMWRGWSCGVGELYCWG